MLLILLTWLYMFFIFSVQGEYIRRIFFRNKLNSIGISVLLGMIFQAIAVTIAAFFYRIHIEYFCCNTALTVALFFLDKDRYIRQLRKNLRWSRLSLALFLLIAAASLMRSALLPFLIDNETYYIQTIKWLNEYGWVKGVANLHLFLIHGSPWHALQAACNFPFLSGNFNDINGFLICVMGFLWVDRLNGCRTKTACPADRWLFFVPLFSVLWFQFVDAPSVDLPLFLFTLLIIHCFLNRSAATDLLAIFLLVFLVFIKVSIAPILLLLFFLVSRKNIKTALPYTLLLGLIYMVKSVWLSGCPFAPYTGFALPLPWAFPQEANFNYQFMIIKDLFDFRHPASNDFLDTALAVTVFSTTAIYGWTIRKEKAQYPVFLFLVSDIAWVLSTAANMRFILPAILYPLAYILSRNRIPLRFVSAANCFFISLAFVPVFVPVDYSGWLKESAHLIKIDTFQPGYILKPAGISKHQALTFKKTYFTNFHYYDPEDDFNFLFLTGNGPLPCVETSYLYQMYRRTGYVPALIGDDLGSGFYSVKIR
ncbi:MAG: hypothetical protein LBH61_01225 [Dysgonamonadaceae bacterium]|nr:hypothetical protein [Dysgonamonadaceae bacterium]